MVIDGLYFLGHTNALRTGNQPIEAWSQSDKNLEARVLLKKANLGESSAQRGLMDSILPRVLATRPTYGPFSKAWQVNMKWAEKRDSYVFENRPRTSKKLNIKIKKVNIDARNSLIRESWFFEVLLHIYLLRCIRRLWLELFPIIHPWLMKSITHFIILNGRFLTNGNSKPEGVQLQDMIQ